MCSEAVLTYLQSTNRPYSANDIVQNLHNVHSKTAIQKALDELTGKGCLREKVYGKQKVYCIIQSEEALCDEELDELNQLIQKKTEDLKKLEQELKSFDANLQALASQPTTEQAIVDNESQTKMNANLLEKLTTLKSGACLIPEKELDKVKSELEKWSRESKKRKRWLDDMLNAVLENYPKSKKALIEEIGLEL